MDKLGHNVTKLFLYVMEQIQYYATDHDQLSLTNLSLPVAIK